MIMIMTTKQLPGIIIKADARLTTHKRKCGASRAGGLGEVENIPNFTIISINNVYLYLGVTVILNLVTRTRYS